MIIVMTNPRLKSQHSRLRGFRGRPHHGGHRGLMAETFMVRLLGTLGWGARPCLAWSQVAAWVAFPLPLQVNPYPVNPVWWTPMALLRKGGVLWRSWAGLMAAWHLQLGLLGAKNSFAAAVFAARGVDQRLVYLHSFDAACLVFRV